MKPVEMDGGRPNDIVQQDIVHSDLCSLETGAGVQGRSAWLGGVGTDRNARTDFRFWTIRNSVTAQVYIAQRP